MFIFYGILEPHKKEEYVTLQGLVYGFELHNTKGYKSQFYNHRGSRGGNNETHCVFTLRGAPSKAKPSISLLYSDMD